MTTPTLLLLPPADDSLLETAESVLTPTERETLAGFQFAKRRNDWLLGRYAAKMAVCRAVEGVWTPRLVEIRAMESGRPWFLGADYRMAGWHLSITHGHGLAAALVSPVPAGIDLEKLRPMEPGGWRFFLTEEERDWLKAEPLGPDGSIVAWALKEAAFKALNGAVTGVLSIRVHEAEGGRARLSHPGGELMGRYVVEEGFCLAIATPAPAATWFDDLPLTLAGT